MLLALPVIRPAGVEGGGGGPDSWQRWGGKPAYEKVWQMQAPALPRSPRETHGGARRLMGERCCCACMLDTLLLMPFWTTGNAEFCFTL
jgi:hypothetical protein